MREQMLTALESDVEPDEPARAAAGPELIPVDDLKDRMRDHELTEVSGGLNEQV